MGKYKNKKYGTKRVAGKFENWKEIESRYFGLKAAFSRRQENQC